MSQRRPVYHPRNTTSLAAVGSLAERAGTYLLIATLPLAVGTGAGLLADAASPAVAHHLALAALEGQIIFETGLASLFQLSSFGLLAGCWILGFGLLLDGLFD